MNTLLPFENPYQPGAGHYPPFLAGREKEVAQFNELLDQDTILTNVVLTGLRGVGKTVLLVDFKRAAQAKEWLWVGNDMSESASVTEEALALRLLADLAIVTATVPFNVKGQKKPTGFGAPLQLTLGSRPGLAYDDLARRYQQTPGLVSDKIKAVLEFVWSGLRDQRQRVAFAYDEAQNLSDHAEKDEYPLSLLLEVFQSIQKKNIPFMLVLTGLPMLPTKLVAARTYAERMFTVMKLNRLNKSDSRAAIIEPLRKENCPVSLDDKSVNAIVDLAGGYPHFIQFICREVYDILIARIRRKEPLGTVSPLPIVRKLDADFFEGRWAKSTDRQRELLWVIAHLDSAESEGEFTIQEIVARANGILPRPFGSSSHVNQMLAALMTQGLIYQDRRGKYLFAVPLMGSFIKRTYTPANAASSPVEAS